MRWQAEPVRLVTVEPAGRDVSHGVRNLGETAMLSVERGQAAPPPYPPALRGAPVAPAPRIALLDDSAIGENVHRAANRALAFASVDLGFESMPRTLRWFELEDERNRASVSRHRLGYADGPTADDVRYLGQTGHLLGFVESSFGAHRSLWIRRSTDPNEAAGAVLHESAHSHQVGQSGRGAKDQADYDEREADARAYATRCLPQLRSLPRVSSWEERSSLRRGGGR